MRTIHLKVKIKSLAAESRIIRHEELKFPRGDRNNATFASLIDHRREVVRPAARSAQLAYGFLRGRAYRRLEATCHEPPNWTEVAKNVARFDNTTIERAAILVKEWSTAVEERIAA